MSRTAKIAAAAMLGGLSVALTIGIAFRSEPPTRTGIVPEDERHAHPPEADLRRCRTMTTPNSGCEAAWEEKRRRFFGKKDRQ
ncbi:conjugative transfer region protein TrbK [Sphingobium sp. B11D3B]|uniref:putative entry exclusion protein TrbK-alt n=1 Tax=Sphingobium sp. B11D3B TaxID=2940575 RepID=UPI0022277576|nr:putative entry exclusion protein TrbK-alt [Sphingobium sp. B11D3B]MCW2387167.1 conjugative transfer region protein TrbK [Sphingobium sp. B11D3B]